MNGMYENKIRPNERKLKISIVFTIVILCVFVVVLQEIDIERKSDIKELSLDNVKDNIIDDGKLVNRITTTVGDDRVRFDNKKFEFSLPKGESGCESSGGRIVTGIEPLKECKISFDVYFDGGDSSFDWASGGQLCSISGGEKSYYCNKENDGFFVNLEWDKDGSIYPVINDNKVVIKSEVTKQANKSRLSSNTWHNITIIVNCNSKEKKNGKVEVKINNKLFYKESGLMLEKTHNVVDYATIQAYHYNTIKGNDSDRNQKIIIRDYTISCPYGDDDYEKDKH